MIEGFDRLTISEIGADPRDPARTVVSLSDGRRFRLDAIRAADLILETGADVDEALEALLAAEEERSVARVRALRYLEARERSRYEVEQRLRRYGYGEPLVTETLGWLVRLGYLDDRRFAEWFARARAGSAWGPRRLQDELRRKGIPRAIIDETVASCALSGDGPQGAVDELAALVERRFARELATNRDRAERRITGFLARRGHGWDTIRAVLVRVAPQAPPEDPTAG